MASNMTKLTEVSAKIRAEEAIAREATKVKQIEVFDRLFNEWYQTKGSKKFELKWESKKGYYAPMSNIYNPQDSRLKLPNGSLVENPSVVAGEIYLFILEMGGFDEVTTRASYEALFEKKYFPQMRDSVLRANITEASLRDRGWKVMMHWVALLFQCCQDGGFELPPEDIGKIEPNSGSWSSTNELNRFGFAAVLKIFEPLRSSEGPKTHEQLWSSICSQLQALEQAQSNDWRTLIFVGKTHAGKSFNLNTLLELSEVPHLEYGRNAKEIEAIVHALNSEEDEESNEDLEIEDSQVVEISMNDLRTGLEEDWCKTLDMETFESSSIPKRLILKVRPSHDEFDFAREKEKDDEFVASVKSVCEDGKTNFVNVCLERKNEGSSPPVFIVDSAAINSGSSTTSARVLFRYGSTWHFAVHYREKSALCEYLIEEYEKMEILFASKRHLESDADFALRQQLMLDKKNIDHRARVKMLIMTATGDLVVNEAPKGPRVVGKSQAQEFDPARLEKLKMGNLGAITSYLSKTVVFSGWGKNAVEDRLYIRQKIHDVLFKGLTGTEGKPSAEVHAIDEVIVYAPCSLLVQGVQWMDAPGYGDLDAIKSDVLAEAVEDVDGALMLCGTMIQTHDVDFFNNFLGRKWWKHGFYGNTTFPWVCVVSKEKDNLFTADQLFKLEGSHDKSVDDGTFDTADLMFDIIKKWPLAFGNRAPYNMSSIEIDTLGRDLLANTVHDWRPFLYLSVLSNYEWREKNSGASKRVLELCQGEKILRVLGDFGDGLTSTWNAVEELVKTTIDGFGLKDYGQPENSSLRAHGLRGFNYIFLQNLPTRSKPNAQESSEWSGRVAQIFDHCWDTITARLSDVVWNNVRTFMSTVPVFQSLEAFSRQSTTLKGLKSFAVKRLLSHPSISAFDLVNLDNLIEQVAESCRIKAQEFLKDRIVQSMMSIQVGYAEITVKENVTRFVESTVMVKRLDRVMSPGLLKGARALLLPALRKGLAEAFRDTMCFATDITEESFSSDFEARDFLLENLEENLPNFYNLLRGPKSPVITALSAALGVSSRRFCSALFPKKSWKQPHKVVNHALYKAGASYFAYDDDGNIGGQRAVLELRERMDEFKTQLDDHVKRRPLVIQAQAMAKFVLNDAGVAAETRWPISRFEKLPLRWSPPAKSVTDSIRLLASRWPNEAVVKWLNLVEVICQSIGALYVDVNQAERRGTMKTILLWNRLVGCIPDCAPLPDALALVPLAESQVALLFGACEAYGLVLNLGGLNGDNVQVWPPLRSAVRIAYVQWMPKDSQWVEVSSLLESDDPSQSGGKVVAEKASSTVTTTTTTAQAASSSGRDASAKKLRRE